MWRIRGACFFLCMFFCACVPDSNAQVEVSTDKDAYVAGETIAISIKNSNSHSIYSAANTATPAFAISNFERRRNQWGWDAYAIRCHRLNCNQGESEEPREIGPGQKITFSWLPEIYEKNAKSVPMQGLYRLTIIYQIKKRGENNWTWETTKSNEFTLQGKTPRK